MNWRSLSTVLFLTGVACMAGSAVADDANQLLEQAQRALLQRRFREAEELATKAIEAKKDFAEAYMLRGRAKQLQNQFEPAITDLNRAIELKPSAESHFIRAQCRSALDQHAEAVADFTRVLELDPKLIAAYHHRGRELFKLGKVSESIADFDRLIELEPSHKNECWERGLSRYYAGQFKKAQESFEDYHKVGPEDIENGLWRMLSQAEIEGLEKAQKDLLEYEPKRRPPFPLLYELYSGDLTAQQVIDRANEGATSDDDRKTRTFYAELYVGMWFVVNKQKDEAARHLEKAVKLRSSDYMWYVARLQLERLKEGK